MQLQNLSQLKQFLSTYLADTDVGQDEATIQKFINSTNADQRAHVISEARQYLTQSTSIVEDLGMETNRWFDAADEARQWLENIVKLLDSNASAGVIVKDSNGAVLQEGDAVTVIKDLKVKGGSNDLKRGTLIKKIHLVDDPDIIECNIGGGTLVLKTCFLKKA